MLRILILFLLIVMTDCAGEFASTLKKHTAVGLIYPFFRVPVPSKGSGVIVEILHEAGEKIQREQCLAILENETQKTRLDLSRLKIKTSEVNLRKSQRNLAYLEKKLKKDRDLVGQGAATQESLEDRLNSYEQAKLELESRNLDLDNSKAEVKLQEKTYEDTFIRAPVQGIIKERLIEPGQQVSAGQTVYEMVVVNPLFIETHLTEDYYGKIRLHQNLSFKVINSSQTGKGQVYFIDPALEPGSRTFRVRIRVENPEEKIIAGRQVELTLPSL